MDEVEVQKKINAAENSSGTQQILLPSLGRSDIVSVNYLILR